MDWKKVIYFLLPISDNQSIELEIGKITLFQAGFTSHPNTKYRLEINLWTSFSSYFKIKTGLNIKLISLRKRLPSIFSLDVLQTLHEYNKAILS